MTFTLLGLLLLIVSYGVWQYRKLLKWKHELKQWEEKRNSQKYAYLVEQIHLKAWANDLEHREQVWKDFKQKVEKDLKWNWKI